MPTIRIPLVVQHTTRGPNANTNIAKDGRIINGIVTTAPNPITRQLEAFVEKRTGITNVSTLSSGKYGLGIYQDDTTTYTCISAALDGSEPTWIYQNANKIGTTDDSKTPIGAIKSAILSGTKHIFFSSIGYVSSSTSAHDAYYYDTSVTATGGTFTADTTSGSAVLANVSSTTNLRDGQMLTGTGIPTETRIAAGGISGTNVTMTKNATANGAGITVTYEALAKIMDVDFPARHVGPILTLNGRNYVLDITNNRIRNSDVNSISSWTADYLSANSEADQSVYQEKLGNNIYVFGQRSIEIFADNGNSSGSPLSRVKTIGIGAIYNTIQPITIVNDVLYFYGYSGGIYSLSEDALQKISTDRVDAILADAMKTAGYFMSIDSAAYGGKFYLNVCINSGSAKIANLLYDIESSIWLEQDFQVGGSSGTLRCFPLGNWGGNNGSIVSTFLTNGQVGLWSASGTTYTDNTNAYTLTIQLPRTDLATGKRKTYLAARLVGDRQSSGTTTLKYSDDDGATFTTGGTFDMTDLGKPIHRLGSSQNGRIWQLTHSANTAWRGQALDIDFDVGVH